MTFHNADWQKREDKILEKSPFCKLERLATHCYVFLRSGLSNPDTPKCMKEESVTTCNRYTLKKKYILPFSLHISRSITKEIH